MAHACRPGPDARRPAGASAKPRPRAPRGWQKVFLAQLAASSNVAASARAAKVSTTTAYDARRADPAFYRAWQEALCEGYDHLEMHLLQRLREGEMKPPTGAKRGTRTFDNATALRLLVAHRESAARQRAMVENGNAEATLAAIDAKIEKMRARAIRPATTETASQTASHLGTGDNDDGVQ